MEPSELLRKFVEVLDKLGIRYRVVGSVASTTYGDPRMTNDIDVVVDLPLEAVDSFCRCFPPEEYYCYQNAILEAVRERRQFNIIHYESGFKIDVFIPAQGPSHEAFLARGKQVTLLPGFDAWFASPEDVILKKLEYYREGGSDKHVSDISGIMKVQGDRVDRAFIASSAERLGLAETWSDVLQRIENS